MPSCLIVRPAASTELNGGDTVVYRRLAEYLGRHADLDTLELRRLPRVSHALNLFRGLPPEVGGYFGASNRARLAEALARRRYDAIVFAHEATFPLSADCRPGQARKIFFSHNVQSVIAESESSLLGPMMRPLAKAFDRRWCADPEATIICISRADVDGMRRIGARRPDVQTAPPGAPPSVALQPGATVLPELVLTGSYGWWRKRRDLKHFAEGAPLAYPILTSDPTALAVLQGQARAVKADEVDWSAGLRFGLITDRFQGGFKLKSLEYVAVNAVVLSSCDLSREFEGLPHAEEFVRFVSSKQEVASAVEEIRRQPVADILGRFQAFKAACMDRYTWDRCLEPFGRALEAPGSGA